MTLTPETTVAQVAAQWPATIPVFESLSIDYCCGGKQSIREACRKAAKPLEPVLERLLAATQSAPSPEQTDWQSAAPSALIRYIVDRHHAYVRRQTPHIDALLAKVVARHGQAHPELAEIQAVQQALAQELETHMFKEEHVLFPHIAALERAEAAGAPAPAACFDSVARPIARMMEDHDDASELLISLRRLSNGFTPPAEACTSYKALFRAIEEFEQDLHRHVHLENNILFPKAIELEAKSGTKAVPAGDRP